MKKEKEKKIETAEERLTMRVTNSDTIMFLLDNFTSFLSDNKDWRTVLGEIQTKFYAYMELRDPDTPVSLQKITSLGLMFLATHPKFSLHEFAEAGAVFTEAELAIFKEELFKILQKPSLRKDVIPYTAAIGMTIVDYSTAKDETLQKSVEATMLDMPKIIAAGHLKLLTQSFIDPSKKALSLLKHLDELGIKMDAEGNIEDTKGIYEKEKAKLQDYERDRSPEQVTEGGTGDISKAPENLN
jgi:hypothetical protein